MMDMRGEVLEEVWDTCNKVGPKGQKEIAHSEIFPVSFFPGHNFSGRVK